MADAVFAQLLEIKKARAEMMNKNNTRPGQPAPAAKPDGDDEKAGAAGKAPPGSQASRLNQRRIAPYGLC